MKLIKGQGTTVSTKMSEARKHHYIPVFYQNYFTDFDRLLFVYDRKCQTFRKLHPRSVCCQSDLYATKPADGRPRDRRLESKILSDIDGKSAAVIRDLLTFNPPTPETLAGLAIFAALQYVRVPTNDTFMRAIYSSGANDMMEVSFWNVERAKASMRNYEEKTGKKLNITPETMVEEVRSRRIEAVANEIPFLNSIGRHSGFMAKTLAKLNLQILISPAVVGFILTDNPFTSVPAAGDSTVGLLRTGTFTYIPVTRSICLRYGATGSDVFRRIEREQVRLINQNLAVNSERFIMGPSLEQLESVVHRSGSNAMDTNPRFAFNKFVDNNGGITRVMSHLPRRRYFYPNL